MFVGRILENGNSAFESRDGKIIEEIPVLKLNGSFGVAYKFEGFNVLILDSAICNLGDFYNKSEQMCMDELFGYIVRQSTYENIDMQN